MDITFIGHSCFKIESKGYSLVFDPYQDGSVPGLKNVRENADAVFCSHGHGDHNAAELVKLSGRKLPFEVTEVKSFHDDAEGTKRGSNVIRVIDDGDFRIVHLGDLGHPLNKEQLEKIGKADCLLIPVGGFYTIDADTAFEVAEAVKAAVTIPMHFRKDAFGYDVIGPVDKFTDHYEKYEEIKGNTYTLIHGEGRKVVLLEPMNK